MLVTLIANNWFINILAAFFISLLDSVAYLLLAAGYNIFYAVSLIDIFGTESGGAVYTEITTKIYTAISVVMVFVFAYYLIMMIIDPEGGKGKSTSALVKETIIAFITVIVLPTVFGYMTLFQKHVLANNTIGNLILGGSGSDNGDFGKQVSLIVFTSFYHPQGSSYSDYFDNDGKYVGVSTATSTCTGAGASQSVCDAWAEGLQEWSEDSQLGAVDAIAKRSKLYNTTNDDGGMYYMWIITTVVGVVAAWFFFSYAIDLGTRAVKLGFLQLVAPIPVLLKIFPQGKKTFDAWFAEIKKCYLEVFLRLAVIFFIVKLCTMVPSFIDAVWNSGNSISGGFLTKALATVCLILGLLKFAKDAPQLFKTIFSSGGGLFAGLDWKPGMKRKISENEYARNVIGAGAVIGGAGVGAMRQAGRKAYIDSAPEGDHGKWKARGAYALAAVQSLPRALIRGAQAVNSNRIDNLDRQTLENAIHAGRRTGQQGETERQNDIANGITFIDRISNNVQDRKDKRRENRALWDGETTQTGALDALDKIKKQIKVFIEPEQLEAEFKKIKEILADAEKGVREDGFYRDNMLDKVVTKDGGMKQIFNKETGRTENVNTISLAQYKELQNAEKRKKAAEKDNNLKDGFTTAMANLDKYLNDNSGLFGKYTKELNDIIAQAGIKDANNNTITTLDQYFKTKSDKSERNVISDGDIKLLEDINKKIGNITEIEKLANNSLAPSPSPSNNRNSSSNTGNNAANGGGK